jgi:hypothetical protein
MPRTAAEPPAAADRREVTRSELPRSIQRIEEAAEYSFKVTVTGSDEALAVEVRDLPPAKVSPQIGKERPQNWVADRWFGNRMVPHVLLVACRESEKEAKKGDGDVRLEFVVPDKSEKEAKETYVFRSRGLAEDVYVLSALGMQKQFAKWLAKAVPDSKEVQPLKPREERPARDEPGAAELAAAEKPPDEWKPVLTAANAKYNEQRPELMKRFGGSFLFYPRLRERDWAAFRRGDQLISGTADLMFYVTFRVEFQQDKDGKWHYVRTQASEEFKGE